MQLLDLLARGATAPIRLGLSLGGAGLSVARTVAGEARTVVDEARTVAGEARTVAGEARTVVDEARRTVAGEDPDRSAGWTRPHPPRVWSPAPAIRRRLARRGSDEPPPMASLDIAEPPAAVRPAPAAEPPAASPESPTVEAPTAEAPGPVADGPAPEAAPPPVPPAAAEGPALPAVRPRGAKTVDDEPVTIAESAERGAEDGAGAEVHVDPPWHGYDALTAADVRDRLAAADASLATAVALYESANRGRVSVVRAAERRLAALA